MINNQEKMLLINKKLIKIKRKIFEYSKRRKYEKCLALISVYCDLQYQLNQIYLDEDIENLIGDLAANILPRIAKYDVNKQKVLFYDGFGLDLRGWAASYIKALNELEYHIIYVTTSESKGKIPHIIKELGDNVIEYIDMSSSYLNWIKELSDVFVKHKPSTAFFYTIPNDVAGAIVFNKFDGLVNRFQIDLTDHAYWLGVNSVDYFLESREMGAGLAVLKRGVPKERIIKTDCVPYINKDAFEEKLPFDIEKQRYIFTGGALYKTLGDEEHLYYQMADNILAEFEDIKFLYAGSGDTTQMQILIDKYPERVFLIDERPDFYRLIEHCEIYLNSYPMFGGLMMRYAALAEKVPLTLKHEHDADGILEHQKTLNVEFDTVEDLLSEARKLLTDSDYYTQRGEQIKNSVLTEEEFSSNLNEIIKNRKSKYVFEDIVLMDTSEFQREYIQRFNIEQYYLVCTRRINKNMFFIMPVSYVRGLLIRIRKRMMRR